MPDDEQQQVRNGEESSCLAWTLCEDAQCLQDEMLLSLHEGILSCAQMMSARVVETSGTCGLLLCNASIDAAQGGVDRGHMTLEDVIIRLGQHICRWALAQDPPFLLRIGVHSGPVKMLPLRVDSHVFKAYYGESVLEAKRLAETACQDSCVRILKTTKDKLNVLERLPFTCSRTNDSYYLEPKAELPEEGPVSSLYQESLAESGRALCTPEFRQMLSSHGIDTSQYGIGQARTLDELYRNVVVEKKSHLEEKSGALVRHVEQVLVSLHACSPDGEDMELRLNCEVLKDGVLVRRNQRPVMIVGSGSAGWKSTVDSFLKVRLGLTDEIRKELLEQDTNKVAEKVEHVKPTLFPGVPTVYKTHEVSINIFRTGRAELQAIGLPDMIKFDTDEVPAANLCRATWSWRKMGEELSNEEALVQLLQEHGIDTNDYPLGSVSELCDELYESRYATLNLRAGHLVRNIQIIKVWLCATILSVDYVLRSKGKMQFGKRERNHKEGPVTMRMRSDQDWKDAANSCLYGKLGMDEAFIKSHLVIVDSSYRLDEEVEYSRSYPGLKTVYNIHTVKCRVKDSDHPMMSFIGLPDGNDFSVTRVRQSLRGSKSSREGLVCTLWFWKPRSQLTEMTDRLYFQKSFTDRPEEDCTPVAKRQLVPPCFLAPELDVDPQSSTLMVEVLMRGRTTAWSRAKRAAKRILDPTYSLKDFHDDCTAAFPELLLYTAEGDFAMTSSGRSSSEEYQRTMGALFAVFWFTRRKIGGAESFCFGVDDEWEPLNSRSGKPRRHPEEVAKRRDFFAEVEWQIIEDLWRDAGLLSDGIEGHDEERTLAMLVLTAIHDIMKMGMLVPEVQAKHAPFCGYEAGDLIQDHDIALSYVLEHHPSALPSFDGLRKEQKDAIRFTQSKMEYNMGWLVQAEAPPGALFTKFKECMLTGGADARDVAFYFCHWLTDLAGAEPYPQEGCEKFVLKFPRKVLSSFLNSFSIVRQLASKTETRVVEEYLVWRWQSHQPPLGEVPRGRGSVAALRLVVMAQGDSQSVLSALKLLSEEDRQVLFTELAVTGCKDQSFDIEELAGSPTTMGPAILIYYAPALMQKAGASDPRATLRILVEIFRQARSLWPFSVQAARESVTVRIDVLKELEVRMIQALEAGEVWALEKTNRRDAEVKKLNLGSQEVSQEFGGPNLRLLDFSNAPRGRLY
eukprot:TRINITY_DN34953_c0_g1_i2.p1 TRINITY_DN34953_c0_g1~~TRINITY_DN34953_c0_g1_i2.p1  ORF type:complete len:1188 (+),score=246.71 TRINITY_DN34953_c0_g1_i2:166-3729(+)